MKLAVCFSKINQDHRQITSQMVDAQKLCPHHIDQIESLHDRGSLGAIQTLKKVNVINHYHKESNGNILAVSGVPIDMQGGLNQKLLDAARGDYKQAARLLKTLDGAFAIVFWDHQNQKLLIVTDILGFAPVYLMHNKEYFVVATEQKAMAASQLVPVEMNPAGWGAFISFGVHIADTTTLKDVRRLAPSRIYTFDAKNFELKEEEYWQWPKFRSNITLDNFEYQELFDIFKQNIKGYMEYEREGTILMSGGFDSRTISGSLAQLGYKPDALIVKHLDEYFNIDGKLGERTCKRLGIHCNTASPRKDHYSSTQYCDFLIKNEVMTPSLYLFISNVSPFVNEEYDAFWEGVSLGYVFKSSHLGMSNFQDYIKLNIKSLDDNRWKAAKKVFSPQLIEQMHSSFREALNNEVANYDNDASGVHGFGIRNHSRNRTAPNPCQVYSNYTLNFIPGAARDFMNIAASVPFDLKKDGLLYKEIIKRQFKEVADIPICSGGNIYMPSNAIGSRAHLKFLKARNRLSPQKLLSKINLAFAWETSRFAREVLERVDPTHPDLNAESVIEIKNNPDTAYGRTYLFYWQVWRWIMEGKINQVRGEIFKDS